MHCHIGLTKRVQIIAFSEDWLELWNVLGDKVQYTKQVMWPQIDRGDLKVHDYRSGQSIFDLPTFILLSIVKIPRDYDIVLSAGVLCIEVDARWPNAMGLLDDLLRCCPSSGNWYRFEEMREEVEKWKSEAACTRSLDLNNP